MVENTFRIAHKMNIRGINLSYRVHPCKAGSKTKGVVFLFHGFMDHSGSWEDIVCDFPENYIYVAVDYRGHGDSDWMPSSCCTYHESDFVLDTVIFIKNIKLEINSIFTNSSPDTELSLNKYFNGEIRVPHNGKIPEMLTLVIGHSFGGFVGLAAAHIKNFEQIDGLISLESNLLRGCSPAEFSRIYIDSYEWIINTNLCTSNAKKLYDSAEEAISRIVDRHISKNPVVSRRLAQDNIKKVGGKYTFKMDPRLSFRFAAKSIPVEMSRAMFSKIDYPVLIVAAKHGLLGPRLVEIDEYIASSDCRKFIKVEVVSGGHHCHMEKEGREEVLGIVSKFLSDASKNSAVGNEIKCML